MKKRIIVKLAAFAVVVCLLASLFAGCTFFKVNEGRIANAELYTIKGYNGINLTLTRNEIIDYFNNYAYTLTNSYGYSVEQALDFVVESKIKNKYLVTYAMSVLTTNYEKRIPVLVGKGTVSLPKDVLTWAEYYAAVYSVNSSIKSSVDDSLKTAAEKAVLSAYNEISKENIASVEFTESTLAYLKSEYYVNQEIDKNQIKINIFYDDETQASDILVPSSLYTTAFASDAEATDSTMVIGVDEKIISSSGTTYETHTLEHTYSVVSPRATETKAEVTDEDAITIGTVSVNRYATVDKIKEALGDEAFNDLVILDLDAKYAALQKSASANADEIDAYRLIIENLSNSYKTITYVYDSAFESAVSSAFSFEKQRELMQAYDSDYWEKEVLAEFKYLYNNAKQTYDETNDVDDAVAIAFASEIKSNLDAYYYHPVVPNLNNYVYVYQILFNFSDAQKKLLELVPSNEDEKNVYFEYLKNSIESQVSNPSYDADYDCPKHELGLVDEPCKYMSEELEDGEPEHVESDCPSLAYMTDSDGNYIVEKFVDVYSRLSAELTAIVGENLENLTSPDAQRSSLEVFKNYMYQYNDDSGIMNSATGYLIAPEGVDDPNGFYESFVDLAHAVFSANPNVGNAFVSDGENGYKLGYAFTDYGVHLIMISLKPFADYNNVELLSGASDEEILNYIKTTRINIAGELEESDPNSNTIYKVLLTSLKDAKKSKLYNDFTNALISQDLHKDENIVTINKKKVDQLYKDVLGE
ncbi:MAG: hypothetical protein LBF68_06245 [Christensenellaceae bacterium]|jgi:hypothetical protein|nr:hypothetical protein [Christensenellaceae bacterium]